MSLGLHYFYILNTLIMTDARFYMFEVCITMKIMLTLVLVCLFCYRLKNCYLDLKGEMMHDTHRLCFKCDFIEHTLLHFHLELF